MVSGIDFTHAVDHVSPLPAVEAKYCRRSRCEFCFTGSDPLRLYRVNSGYVTGRSYSLIAVSPDLWVGRRDWSWEATLVDVAHRHAMLDEADKLFVCH